MALTLRLLLPGGGDAPSLTLDEPLVVVGRGRSCEVRLPDPSVSHRHATIRQHGAGYRLEDEGSTNGTWVGRARLPRKTPHSLSSGDRVRFGRVWLEVTIDHRPVTGKERGTMELALELVARSLDDDDAAEPRVVVEAGPDRGAELRLGASERWVIGRAPGCELVLSEEAASREHVALRVVGDELLVEDLGSKNGSVLGDRLLEPGAPLPWRFGVALAIGETRLVLRDSVSDELRRREELPDALVSDTSDTPPPSPAAVSEPDDEPASDSDAAALPPPAAPPPAAPVLAGPSPRAHRPVRWGAPDWLIALVALALIGASVGGLLWVLGSGP